MRQLILWAVAVLLWPTLGAAQSSATLAGVVLADSSERPIAGAEIAIAELRRTVRSDSAGAFVLTGIKAGRHQVVVRAVGYAELRTDLVFAKGQRVEADLLLPRAAQELAKVNVTATKSTSGNNPRINEFDERRKLGLGRFLTQDVFEKGEGRKLAEVLIQRMPGVRTVRLGFGRALVSTRGRISFSGRPCYLRIIIDDLVREGPVDIDDIDPQSIAAIEYYTVAQTPAEFNRGGAPCGTLVIWTRW